MKFKISAREIALTGIFLAVALVSQYFKNLSVYITGPVVNACIFILSSRNLLCGVILGLITPVTAFLITGSPVMSLIPLIIPAICLGNVLLALTFSFLSGKTKSKVLPIISAGIVKAVFMGIVISEILLPLYLPEKMLKNLSILKIQFSFTQAVTALIGGFYYLVISKYLQKIF